MTTQRDIWSAGILRDCLLEAGEDVLSGLAAAQYILATQPVPLSTDAHGHDHKGKGEGGGQFTSKSTVGDNDAEKISSKEFKAWFGDWDSDPASASKVVDEDTKEPKETHQIKIKKVFHGGQAGFDTFDKNKIGAVGKVGKGFYFAEDERISTTFKEMHGDSGRTVTAYLNVRRPFDFDKAYTSKEVEAIYDKAVELLGKDKIKKKKFNHEIEKAIDRAISRDAANYKFGTLPGFPLWEALHEVCGDRVNDVLSAIGHDGIVHRAGDKYGIPKDPRWHDEDFGKCWVVFEPNQIKSVDNKGGFDTKSNNIYLAHDVHNPAAQKVLTDALKAMKGMTADARRTLATALKKADPERNAAIIAFVEKYRLQIARLLSTTQFASLLQGMREVADAIPTVIAFPGAVALPPTLEPKEAAELVEEVSSLNGDERAKVMYDLPPAHQTYVMQAVAAKEAGPIDAPPKVLRVERTGGPEDVHLDTIDKAVEALSKKNVLTRDLYDKLSASVRSKSFTVAGVAAEETLTKVRDALAENVQHGADYPTFREKVLETVGTGTFLSPAHMETVFRTNVQGALSDGQMTVLQQPGVRDGFPYSAYDAIHDDRVRENHLALEKHGIDGGNVYRTDDPVFQLFRPPWDYNDRCGWTPITVRQAAERGIPEAQEWLRTGVEPLKKSYVSMPDFRPPPGFERDITAVPLSIRLSLQPVATFSTDATGHDHKGKGKGGGQFTSTSGSDEKQSRKEKRKEELKAARRGFREVIKKIFNVDSAEQGDDVNIESEGRSLNLEYDPYDKSVYIDYTFSESGPTETSKKQDKDSNSWGQTGSKLQTGTVSLLHKFTEMLGALSKVGVGVSYETLEPRRRRIYAKALTAAGYEETPTGNPDISQWRPKTPTSISASLSQEIVEELYASLSTDATGHDHRGKGVGGGQFTSTHKGDDATDHSKKIRAISDAYEKSGTTLTQAEMIQTMEHIEELDVPALKDAIQSVRQKPVGVSREKLSQQLKDILMNRANARLRNAATDRKDVGWEETPEGTKRLAELTNRDKKTDAANKNTNSADDSRAKAKAEYKKLGTRAPSFLKWFGDWTKGDDCSKVVNDKGEPLETSKLPDAASKVQREGKAVPVYHGTPGSEFNEFRKDKLRDVEALVYGGGFYFAEDQKLAEKYSKGESGKAEGTVLSCYLNIRKPFDVSQTYNRAQVEELTGAKLGFFSRLNRKMSGKKDTYTGDEVYQMLTKKGGRKAANERLRKMGHDGIFTNDLNGEKTNVWIAFEPTQIKSAENEGTFDANDPNIKLAIDNEIKNRKRLRFISEIMVQLFGEDAEGMAEELFGEGADGESDMAFASGPPKVQRRYGKKPGPGWVAGGLSRNGVQIWHYSHAAHHPTTPTTHVPTPAPTHTPAPVTPPAPPTPAPTPVSTGGPAPSMHALMHRQRLANATIAYNDAIKTLSAGNQLTQAQKTTLAKDLTVLPVSQLRILHTALGGTAAIVGTQRTPYARAVRAILANSSAAAPIPTPPITPPPAANPPAPAPATPTLPPPNTTRARAGSYYAVSNAAYDLEAGKSLTLQEIADLKYDLDQEFINSGANIALQVVSNRMRHISNPPPALVKGTPPAKEIDDFIDWAMKKSGHTSAPSPTIPPTPTVPTPTPAPTPAKPKWMNPPLASITPATPTVAGQGTTGPPGPPPRPGLVWNPTTHRWIRPGIYEPPAPKTPNVGPYVDPSVHGHGGSAGNNALSNTIKHTDISSFPDGTIPTSFTKDNVLAGGRTLEKYTHASGYTITSSWGTRPLTTGGSSTYEIRIDDPTGRPVTTYDSNAARDETYIAKRTAQVAHWLDSEVKRIAAIPKTVAPNSTLAQFAHDFSRPGVAPFKIGDKDWTDPSNRAAVNGFLKSAFPKLIGAQQHTPHGGMDTIEHTMNIINPLNLRTAGLSDRDAEILRLGMVFHDVGKQYNPKDHDHPRKSATDAEPLLWQFGLNEKEVHDTLAVIKWHDAYGDSLQAGGGQKEAAKIAKLAYEYTDDKMAPGPRMVEAIRINNLLMRAWQSDLASIPGLTGDPIPGRPDITVTGSIHVDKVGPKFESDVVAEIRKLASPPKSLPIPVKPPTPTVGSAAPYLVAKGCEWGEYVQRTDNLPIGKPQPYGTAVEPPKEVYDEAHKHPDLNFARAFGMGYDGPTGQITTIYHGISHGNTDKVASAILNTGLKPGSTNAFGHGMYAFLNGAGEMTSTYAANKIIKLEVHTGRTIDHKELEKTILPQWEKANPAEAAQLRYSSNNGNLTAAALWAGYTCITHKYYGSEPFVVVLDPARVRITGVVDGKSSKYAGSTVKTNTVPAGTVTFKKLTKDEIHIPTTSPEHISIGSRSLPKGWSGQPTTS